MIELNLTPTEGKILDHRLMVSDAVVEAVSESYGYHPQDIEEICDAIIARDWKWANYFSPNILKEVLIDALDGNTYLCGLNDAVIDGEITASQARTIRKAAETLSNKVFNATGCKATVPLC